MLTAFALVILSIPTPITEKNFSVGTKPIGVYSTSKECTEVRDLINKGLPEQQEAVCIRAQRLP